MSYLLKYCIKPKKIIFRPGGVFTPSQEKIFLVTCNLTK
nr:hypothetical protein [Klebsiella michiganensis]UGK55356.1 Hypothetical protein [Raoultella ornithinolytica]UMW96378.1 hypothetical protein [Raoultella ornithinolytica]UWX38094.1 hypothetical protein KJK04_p0450 [Klebsiella quasipneumoniae]